MTYIVVKQPPECHQMTLEEFLFGIEQSFTPRNKDKTATRTYNVKDAKKYCGLVDIDGIIDSLRTFNLLTEGLRSKDRHSLYREFHIPKKSGGLRKIDAPNPELMNALRTLKTIFEEQCCGEKLALYHTSAFAYIRKRNTIDAVKKHQSNASRWYAKFDLSNFFGSTTPDFVMHMLSMIFPFSEVISRDDGRVELEKAIDLAFLDGGLPQGTPISPTITNIIMIPIDFALSNGLREFRYKGKDGEEVSNHCVYTRYADDFLVSSKYNFDFRQVESWIKHILQDFNAPFTIKEQKTRYGSSAGSNWNLGVIVNKDNKITIGHKKKRHFRNMLEAYVKDKKNGIKWEINNIQVMEGYRNYYRMVEGEEIDNLVEFISRKFGIDVVKEIKADLKG